MSEHELGLKVEREHSATIKAIMADAKAGKLKPLESYIGMFTDDHLGEIKDYYTRLMKMEKDAKNKKPVAKGKEIETEEDDDKRSDAAFNTFKSLEEKNSGLSTAVKDEPYFPSVSIEFDGGNEYKVGEEKEITFQAEVESVTKSKSGVRVSFRLKGIKE